MFSENIELFLAGKTEYGEQTKHQARATFRLWTELAGDGPVREATGAQAVDFQHQLRKLPKTHGKGRGPDPAPEAISRAEAGGLPRIAEKTVKRHFSALSQYWLFLKRSGHVDKNIFEGFEFPGSKSGRTAREDWSNEDIRKLIGSDWNNKHIDVDTARRMIQVAAYSGMRIEEIARLRPTDFRKDGDHTFIIIDQREDWGPKSEAGERAVPVHPKLIEMGFLDFVQSQKAAGRSYIFHKLRATGPNKSLSSQLSREFSRHKRSIGVDNKTTFHSFRHSVSTILRTSDASISGERIDAVLGHEGGQKSMGATVYLKRIGPQNLFTTICALEYPPDIDWTKLFRNT
jgi:integrase